MRAVAHGLFAVAFVAHLAAGCGGRSHEAHQNGDDDGTGGTGAAGAGGTEASGGAGATAPTGGTGEEPSCSFDGRTYPNGAAVPSRDCNTCWCAAGSIACTMRVCTDCSDTATSYVDALEAAKRCDPFADEQCTKRVPADLRCGCPTFVADTTELDTIRSQWDPGSCNTGVECGPCPPEPGHGECSADGECIDVPLTGTGENCTFEYLGDWVRCEYSGFPNTYALGGATSLEDCFDACRSSPRCTSVIDYFWLGDPELGCALYTSTCDAPAMPDFAEEDGGKEYRKVCAE